MKQKKVLLSALGLSTLGVLSLSSQAFSQPITTSETATATFELVAPADALKLTQVTDIMFKQAVISVSNSVTTNAEPAIVTLQELSGEAPGWRLSAQLGNFYGSSNGKTLNGAQMFYPSITPTTTNAGNISQILPVSEATDHSFEGTATGKIVTAGSDAVTIVTANKGKGYGDWTMTYPEDTMQLNIPAGNLKDNYTAILTYTVVDSPL